MNFYVDLSRIFKFITWDGMPEPTVSESAALVDSSEKKYVFVCVKLGEETVKGIGCGHMSGQETILEEFPRLTAKYEGVPVNPQEYACLYKADGKYRCLDVDSKVSTSWDNWIPEDTPHGKNDDPYLLVMVNKEAMDEYTEAGHVLPDN